MSVVSKIFTKFKILFIAMFAITALFAQPNLKLTLSQAKQNVNTAAMTVRMTNDTNESIKVLKWNTPFEKTLSANIFHVTDGKNNAQYLGRVVKRLHPTDADYITLQAGEIKEVTVDLSKYYRLQTKGKYFVSYKGTVKVKKDALQSALDVLSKMTIPSMQFTYTPVTTQKKTTNSTTTSAKLAPSFNACSQSQIDTLNFAHDAAITIAQDASTVMNAAVANTSGDRYRTWFGAADSGRQSTVTTHFNNIYSALDTENVVFDCSCTDSFFAYVYPSQPYKIYLCNAFWSASLNGTDSQAGTLIHETSHFTVVAATDDYVYGQSGAKDLAISNPNNAIFNADNHEYFSENTPNQSMNNSFDSATVITDIMGDLPFDGNISIAGETDIVSFTVQNTGIYTFYTTGTLDSFGRLYSNGYLLLKSDDDSGVSLNFKFSVTLTQGQSFYLEVSAYSTNIGVYTLNSSFDIDTDGDGIGNTIDTDDDNDGILDANDAFPLNASESVDTDGDDIGNNADQDDDNDGISDVDEVANGLNPLNASDAQGDLDADGFSNSVEIAAGTDIRNASSKPIWTPIFTGDGLLIIVPVAP